MRQKKSNLIFYIIALVIVAFIGFITFTEIPVETIRVEEPVK